MIQFLDYMPLNMQLPLLSPLSSSVKRQEHTSVAFKLYSTETWQVLLTVGDEEEGH